MDEINILNVLTQYVADSSDMPSLRFYEGDLLILIHYLKKINSKLMYAIFNSQHVGFVRAPLLDGHRLDAELVEKNSLKIHEKR
jgi:hypothetical protein